MLGEKKKLRVAVDMHSLALHPTGIGNYIKKLCSELFLSDEFTWFAYHPKEILEQSITDLPNVTIRQNSRIGTVSSLLWNQTILPLWVIEDDIDILFSPNHRLPLLLRKKTKGVVTVHDLTCFKFPKTMTLKSRLADQILLRISYFRASRILSVSQSTKQDLLQQFGGDASFISVTHLASTIEEIPTIKLRTPLENSDYLLFVGTIEPRKNLPFLINAFAELRKIKNLGSLKLKIVGKVGWGNLNLHLLINRLNLQQSIEIYDFCSDEDLASHYLGTKLVVMTSLYEGFGLPILEAFSAKAPVLAPKCASFPELIFHDDFMYQPNDISSFVQKAIQLLEPASEDHFRKIAYQRGKQFTWKATAKQTQQVFKDCQN